MRPTTTFLIQVTVDTDDPIRGESLLIDLMHGALTDDDRPELLAFTLFQGSITDGTVTGDAAGWIPRATKGD